MAKLIVTDGDRTHLVDLEPGESVTLGRSHDCELAIGAPRASRRHATIRPADGGGHGVEDLGSTNGTLLNGARVAGAVRLQDRDVLDVGGCRVVYRAGP